MKRKLIIAYGCLIILTILFAFLKFYKVIKWGWVWVLAPSWMPLAIALIFAIIVLTTIVSQRRKRLGIDD